MNDREKWRETVRDIRAGGATWWWWWWLILCISFFVFTFLAQLLCNHSNSQLIISSQDLPYPIIIDLSLTWRRPTLLGFIFHLLTIFFEPIAPLKNACVFHGVISSECDRVLPKQTRNSRFISFSVLVVEQTKKKELLTKAFEKMQRSQ